MYATYFRTSTCFLGKCLILVFKDSLKFQQLKSIYTAQERLMIAVFWLICDLFQFFGGSYFFGRCSCLYTLLSTTRVSHVPVTMSCAFIHLHVSRTCIIRSGKKPTEHSGTSGNSKIEELKKRMTRMSDFHR